MSKDTLIIPASLIPEFEAWGKLTMQLFGQLRQLSTVEPRSEVHSVELILPDQLWYFTSQWQQWEQEAEADIEAGRVKKFTTMEALVADLGL